MTRKHDKMHRSQHYLTKMQIEALNALSAHTGVTASEHMRRAVDIYTGLTANQKILQAQNPAQMELEFEPPLKVKHPVVDQPSIINTFGD